MKNAETTGAMRLAYTLFCDDVRLEVGNKLSLMGVFHQIVVQQFPVTVMKFAVVSQWRGEGTHLSEVRILTHDRQLPVVVSEPAPFEVAPGGVANNVGFFFNVVFPAPGKYWVQTLLDSTLFDEQELHVIAAAPVGAPLTDDASEAVN